MTRTDTKTLIAALRTLSRDIQSDDGVANTAIAEAADRLEELHDQAGMVTMWLNVDGSPCDGFRFREELAKLRAMVGNDPAQK